MSLSAERHELRDDEQRLAEIVDVIRCCLIGWRQIVGGGFCSWRPILNGLETFGLNDPVLIDRACEILGVERQRRGAGERWRLAP